MNHEAITNLYTQISDNSEFEVRFGNFNKSHFNPTISFQTYQSILHTFSFPDPVSTLVSYYNDNIRSISKGLDQEHKDKVWQQKNTIKNIDNRNYNFRCSLSAEKDIAKPNNLSEPTFYRSKQIHSFVVSDIRIDLFQIKESKSLQTLHSQPSVFQVELEVISKNSTDNLFTHIDLILKFIQQSNAIISNSEIHSVINQYKTLAATPYFIGVQPVTLSSKNLHNLSRQPYSVTDKADGERKFLFIARDGIYILSSSMQVQKTCLTGGIPGTIIDGELINHNLFSAFDIMIYNSQDLRNDKNYPLKTRLDLIKETFSKITPHPSLSFNIKKFLFGDVFKQSKSILDYFKQQNIPYAIDGLIFTPVNLPYPTFKTWNLLLKWKPPALNTIDFLIEKQKPSETHEIWHLLCSSKTGNIPFQPPSHPNSYIAHVPINNAFHNNTVAEFKYENNQFIPIKTRWDKFTKGNFINVALDIFSNILDPVTEDTITTPQQPRQQQPRQQQPHQQQPHQQPRSQQSDFYGMRKFHNWIKSNDILKYTQQKTTLLDLACGKAGDIHKWLNSSIHTITGIDINPDYITEAKRRTQETLRKTNSDKTIDLHLLNLSTQSITNDLGITDSYDIINCQFALHYFFKSPETAHNFFQNVSSHLNNNGFFIGTLFDGMKVFNTLQNGDIHHTKNNSTLVKITKHYSQENFTELNDFGEQINVFLGGSTILTVPDQSGTPEYIVNFNTLVNLAKQYDLELVESNLFQNLYRDWIINNNGSEFSDIEKDFSFLNRNFIFRKISYSQKLLTVDELMNSFFTQSQISAFKNNTQEEQPTPVPSEQPTPVPSEQPTVPSEQQLQLLKVPELKELCKSRKLKSSGKKQDLITRLMFSR